MVLIMTLDAIRYQTSQAFIISQSANPLKNELYSKQSEKVRKARLTDFVFSFMLSLSLSLSLSLFWPKIKESNI